MSIDDVKDWITTTTAAVVALRTVKDMLPAGPNRDHAERLIEEAEKKIRNADASAAKAFGYALCFLHYPPGIMIRQADHSSQCQTCGNHEPFSAGPPQTIYH